MKVLVISHNPFSTYQNMGKTLMSLFSSFEKNELCQLYIHPTIPDVDRCSSYFRITDKSVLKGVLSFSVKGDLIEYQNGYGKEAVKALFKKPKKHMADLFRDIVWKMSRWYSSKLKRWIEKETPTCIFVAIGGNKFLYNMAMKISKKNNLPIVVYICDNYFSLFQKGIINRFWLLSLQKKTTQLILRSSSVVVISSLMKKYYEERFRVPISTIMTGSSLPIESTPKTIKSIRIIRFFGNTTLGRYETLAEFCRAIDEINKENSDTIKVEIYSGSVNDKENGEFSHIKCASFYGFLTGEDFINTFVSSDALIHVESFDEGMVERVRFSISTKLGDCLASGIPLFVFGPNSVASISEFVDEGFEFVCSERSCLKRILKKWIYDKKAREESVLKQLQMAEKYHNKEKNSLLLREVLLNAENSSNLNWGRYY